MFAADSLSLSYFDVWLMQIISAAVLHVNGGGERRPRGTFKDQM